MIGKLRLLLWVGIIVLFLPYIGFPSTVKTGFTIILGIVIIVTTYRLRKSYKAIKFKLRQVEETNSQTQIHE